MNLYELSKKRKTVRKFSNKIPDIEDIKYAINVAKEAPSGKNDQPWLFVLVSSENKKNKIREICEKGEKAFYENSKGKLKEWLDKKGFSWKKPFLTEAPYLLFVYSNKKSPFSKESVWLSLGYFLLALEEKGLSTVTYTPSNYNEISEYMKVPKDYRLEVILPIGYSIDPKPKYERKSIEELLIILK
ncbi:Nitroreductase [Marinitoga hydrogenitolerans DSM 16785]|uniref:Nitroreductase n=1 Tax=Marinitoga hydrogenitolerans (strain DSM 16785 / JCM 12826 / AT1271) TaxID=1122195 RepID=A0A1M4YV87_MARH1|nr:nitroreductase family protein [Marinitoga hydrogenitolerans]SHF09402.1 Nitroreductase [Marinitoga hydrogenitolerans DSM 16785]